MSFKVTGQEVITTLSIKFTDSNDTITYQNADTTPTVTLYLDGSVLYPAPTLTISNPTTGIYSITWTPSLPGQYQVVWSFTVSGIAYSQDEDVFVLSAANSSVTEEGSADIGNENVCMLTGTFIDAGGDYVKGVLVRFSPISAQQEHTSYGYVAGDITAESNASGYFSMNAVRGSFGLLTITHVGLVRRVTIPDKSTVDVFDLAAEGEDLLEVQTPSYYTLPRRTQ